MDQSEYLRRQTHRINQALDRCAPPETTQPVTIHKAMRYSLMAGGKRIRPILAMAACDAIQPDLPGIEDAACALELVHTYSLVHDDLPALDNDDLRRGKPTCHRMFGDAIAILAGDALLTLAFQVLSKLENCSDHTKAELTRELATAAGTTGGMIGGQVNDIEAEGKVPSPRLLETIHQAKTGALLRCSVRFGAIYAGANEFQLRHLTQFGEKIGLAFQIVDDILDVEQPTERLGKTSGKDATQMKMTYPTVYGVNRSKVMAQEELAAALEALEPLSASAQWLVEIAKLIVHRKA